LLVGGCAPLPGVRAARAQLPPRLRAARAQLLPRLRAARSQLLLGLRAVRPQLPGLRRHASHAPHRATCPLRGAGGMALAMPLPELRVARPQTLPGRDWRS
jgi:hypothetical protein